MNDALINFYLKYLEHALLDEETNERVYMFTTFFYPRLAKVTIGLLSLFSSVRTKLRVLGRRAVLPSEPL